MFYVYVDFEIWECSIVAANTATADCNFISPTADIIIAATTTTELHPIADPTSNTTGDTDGTTYLGCAPFLPTPWLVDSILAAKSNNPWELILAALVSAKAFDMTHGSNPTHLKDFVQWAWGVKMLKVPPTSYHLDVTDAALNNNQQECQSKCIHQATSAVTIASPRTPTIVHSRFWPKNK